MIAVPISCCTVALLLAAARADSSSRPQQISHGCPGRFTGYDVRPSSLDSVVAVARRVAIDHVIAHYQGHAIRRTVSNYPVLEVVELDTAPVLPAQQALRRVSRASMRHPHRARVVGGDLHGYRVARLLHEGRPFRRPS